MKKALRISLTLDEADGPVVAEVERLHVYEGTVEWMDIWQFTEENGKPQLILVHVERPPMPQTWTIGWSGVVSGDGVDGEFRPGDTIDLN